jgi:hypothetical protein
MAKSRIICWPKRRLLEIFLPKRRLRKATGGEKGGHRVMFIHTSPRCCHFPNLGVTSVFKKDRLGLIIYQIKITTLKNETSHIFNSQICTSFTRKFRIISKLNLMFFKHVSLYHRIARSRGARAHLRFFYCLQDQRCMGGCYCRPYFNPPRTFVRKKRSLVERKIILLVDEQATLHSKKIA